MREPVSTYILSIPDGSATKKQMALEAMAARYPNLKFEVARIPYPDDKAACIPSLGWSAMALLGRRSQCRRTM